MKYTSKQTSSLVLSCSQSLDVVILRGWSCSEPHRNIPLMESRQCWCGNGDGWMWCGAGVLKKSLEGPTGPLILMKTGEGGSHQLTAEAKGTVFFMFDCNQMIGSQRLCKNLNSWGDKWKKTQKWKSDNLNRLSLKIVFLIELSPSIRSYLKQTWNMGFS